MFARILAVGAVAMLAAAVPVRAEDTTSSKKQKDPNEIVCEKTEVLGSRLAKKKICMTRAQWAEQRRLNRQEVDKVQISRGSCEGCQ
jgi:hypothetical protein